MKRYVLMFAAASLAAPVSAQAAPEERIISLSTAGVRFDHPSSVAELRVKVSRAVRTVCQVDGRSLRDHLASRKCQVDATQRSEERIAQLLSRTRLATAAMPSAN